LIFPECFVTDKKLFRQISVVFADALGDKKIKLQVCPLDLGVAKDGRFNSLTEDFRNHLSSDAKILVGPDYRDRINYFRFKDSTEGVLSHNLRKARLSILLSEHNRRNDYGEFLNKFDTLLSAVSGVPKQIMYLIDRNLRASRFSSLEILSSTFPNLDIEPLERIKWLYNNHIEYDGVYHNPEELVDFSMDALGFFENVIKSYVGKFPLGKNRK